MINTEKTFVWNIAEVIEKNSIQPDKKITRTLLVQGKHCSASVVQAQPQDMPRIHIHHNHEEFLYVLEGEGWFHVGEEKIAVKPGSFVYCPAGVEHGFCLPMIGRRISIYGPVFDFNNPDRSAVGGEEQN